MTKKETALTKHTPQQLAAASQSLTALAALYGEGEYNLLAPTTHMAIPKGMQLSITEVRVSPVVPKYGSGEDVVAIAGGKLLVLRHKLDQIAAAAGISWFVEERKDGGRHPHYCEAFVRGRIVDYDGTVREITGSKTIDVRESVGGVPGKDYSEIVDKQKSKGGDPTKQLRELRKFIAEIAFSKAKNRAIAQALGIKRSYTKEQLAKPFVIPKLALDPTDADARELVMANAVNATEALFGAKAKNKPLVVEAQFEEPDPEPEPAPEEPPPHNESTGELETVDSLIRSAWAEAKAADRNAQWFRALANATVGKTDRAEMTLDEAQQIAAAVTKTITGPKAEDEGLPC